MLWLRISIRLVDDFILFYFFFPFSFWMHFYVFISTYCLVLPSNLFQSSLKINWNVFTSLPTFAHFIYNFQFLLLSTSSWFFFLLFSGLFLLFLLISFWYFLYGSSHNIGSFIDWYIRGVYNIGWCLLLVKILRSPQVNRIYCLSKYIIKKKIIEKNRKKKLKNKYSVYYYDVNLLVGNFFLFLIFLAFFVFDFVFDITNYRIDGNACIIVDTNIKGKKN